MDLAVADRQAGRLQHRLVAEAADRAQPPAGRHRRPDQRAGPGVTVGPGPVEDVQQRPVREAGQDEVEVADRGLHGVLALGRGLSGAAQLRGPEPQHRALLLGLLVQGDVLEEPGDPERDRLLPQRGAEPDELAAPAAAAAGLGP